MAAAGRSAIRSPCRRYVKIEDTNVPRATWSGGSSTSRHVTTGSRASASADVPREPTALVAHSFGKGGGLVDAPDGVAGGAKAPFMRPARWLYLAQAASFATLRTSKIYAERNAIRPWSASLLVACRRAP